MKILVEKHSKTKTSFYRRVYVTYLIDTGTNTVPSITDATGMPRRTAQDTILALKELGVACEFVGGNKNGLYKINDWGAISKQWVAANLADIKRVLGY